MIARTHATSDRLLRLPPRGRNNAHARFPQSKKWPTVCMRTMLAALRSLQRSIFRRKNGSIKLIVVTCSVDRIVCGTNKQSRSELKHGQTDTQTDPTTVTLAAHARIGLIIHVVPRETYIVLHEHEQWDHCTKCNGAALTEMLSMNLIMSALCLMMKGLRLVMNGSLVLNSTRLARFCIALATNFRVRSEASDGLAAYYEQHKTVHCTCNPHYRKLNNS